MTDTTACDGCLGTTRCWICEAEGCTRCGLSGQCHLCDPVDAALRRVPRQARPAAEARRSGV